MHARTLSGSWHRASKKSRANAIARLFPAAGDNSGRDGAYFNITNNPRWLSLSPAWPEASCVSVHTRTLPAGLAKPEIVALAPTMVTAPVAVTPVVVLGQSAF